MSFGWLSFEAEMTLDEFINVLEKIAKFKHLFGVTA